MSLGKVVELHSQAKQDSYVTELPLFAFMSRGSKLIGPRTARFYAFHLLRLSVGR